MLGPGGHTDLMTVGRQPKKETASDGGKTVDATDLKRFIVVDQIRRLSQLAALTPRHGKRRVFIVDPADRMNLEAQNALLKTLEEPPPRTVLILITSRPRVLLPTVRSRCFSLAFSALRTSELSMLLQRRGLSADEAATRSALSQGRPGRALEIELDKLIERREELLDTLEALAGDARRVDELPGRAGSLAGKDETTLLESLDLLQALLRDAARAAAGAEGLIHADLEQRIRQLGERLGAERASTLVGTIDRLRGDLRLNLNRTLVAEAVLAAVAGGASGARP
jgi:DNA polymerase-3 subunit delta'